MEIRGKAIRDKLLVDCQKNPQLSKLSFYLLRSPRPESETYLKGVEKILQQLHINYISEVAESIEVAKNKVLFQAQNPGITSIIVARPFFDAQIENEIFDLIPLKKDVDMLSTVAAGHLMRGDLMFLPATSRAVKTLIEEIHYDLVGKKTLVIGRSPSVGAPIFWYLQKANATVILTHSRSNIADIKKYAQNCDLIVLAAGKCLLSPDDIMDRALVIDCGYHEDGKGDLNFKPDNANYTPVPGGVGPITTVALIANALNLYDRFY